MNLKLGWDAPVIRVEIYIDVSWALYEPVAIEPCAVAVR